MADSDYNTKDIIRIIVKNDQEREKIYTEYDKADKPRKFEMQRIFWKAFQQLNDEITQIKYQELLEDVKSGKAKLTDDLFIQARKSAWQYFESVLSGKAKETEQIDEIRNKLKELTSSLTTS